MLRFGEADLLQVADGLLVEAQGGEVTVGELGEAFAVVGIFQVFEGESTEQMV